MNNKIRIELENIFLEHHVEWCLMAYTYLNDKIEAEEVVQDVCVKLLLRESGSEILNLRAYITTAIKNNSIQRAKKLKNFVSLSESKTIECSYEEAIISIENRLFIQKAMSALPELSKAVFNLCVLEGEKYQNAADTLGISVNTIKYHLKKSYKMLRANIQNIYFLSLFLFF